ncbi:MAG TPA: ChaB family protein [Myxococcaceae bacterium]|jgi:cation transport regulator|nr:ChaB family protein [Myxococcaceae bacterium]
MKHGPFPTNADLPATVQHRLPERAQDIFREAFNHCFDRHGDQEHGARMAWSAVKRRYEEMPDGNWVASPHEGGGARVSPGTSIRRRAS